MSTDFWAGYISGAAGILVGNPLDIKKVQLQSGGAASLAALNSSRIRDRTYYANLTRGAFAPILGYGALNAILFIAYNRALIKLDPSIKDPTDVPNTTLTNIWSAGAIGGLASWIVSAPTELVKCQTQLSSDGKTSWIVARDVWQRSGIRGLYLAGGVTSIRDAVGYGFYFGSYELCKRRLSLGESDHEQAATILLCGGIAGVVTWASVFPLDVIKTRMQSPQSLESGSGLPRSSALQVASQAYNQGGVTVFFRGLSVCSVRAFVVNAIQWTVYEWIMRTARAADGQREALGT